MKVQFTDNPADLLVNKLVEDRIPLTTRLANTHRLVSYAVVTEGTDLVAVADVSEFLRVLAKDIAKNLWKDRGVDVVGGLIPYKGSHKARQEIFKATLESDEVPEWILWWLLDDIALQGIKLGDMSFSEEANAYAEQKIIEYCLAQQKEEAA